MERTPYRAESHWETWKAGCQGKAALDRFCSSPFWGVPLNDAFCDGAPMFVYQQDEELAVFVERTVRGGVMILPADSMWLLGMPLLSSEPQSLLAKMVDYWAARPLSTGIRQIVISGIYPGSELDESDIWRRLNAWEIEPAGRMVASLLGGVDGFMSRRSKNFRSRLRRTVKAAQAHEIEVEFMPRTLSTEDCVTLMDRVFLIEEESWKGQAGRGIDTGSMRTFYQLMLPRLGAEGRLRGLFLKREGKDLAYLFGAVFSDYFRGLQFSHVQDESIGLGNVCQFHMIESLVEEGCKQYDLGQAMAYKRRWAEQDIQSRSFVFQV